MVKHISEKQKNSPFPKKKSLVGLTPDFEEKDRVVVRKTANVEQVLR